MKINSKMAKGDSSKKRSGRVPIEESVHFHYGFGKYDAGFVDREKLSKDVPKTKTGKDLGKLQAQVEKKKPKKAPDDTNKELIDEYLKDSLDIYGGDPEKQKAYYELITEMIEVLNPDKLYRYIKGHNGYKGGDWRKWNMDFREDVLELNLSRLDEIEGSVYASAGNKKAEARTREKRIAHVMQLFLVNAEKKNVFRLGGDKNPFVHPDGKLGGYSVGGVMRFYWNKRYSAKRPNLSALQRSKLDRKYGKIGTNKAVFEAALTELDRLVAGEEVSREVA